MKCEVQECCREIKLPLEIFRSLRFLPEPEPDTSNPGHYKVFSEVYRKHQPDPFVNVPSVQQGSQSVDGRGTFQRSNIVGKIICTHCRKPRCVFLKLAEFKKKVPDIAQQKRNWRVVCNLIAEEVDFACGGDLPRQ